MLDLKELRKITAECRKLGIKALSTPDLSLTLSDVAPVPQKRKGGTKESILEASGEVVESDVRALSKEEQEYAALFWSSAGADS